MAKKRKVAHPKTKSDAKESNLAAEKPKRRVSVGRKQGPPNLPVEVQHAIAKAVHDLYVEELREIVIKQEEQLNAMRTIMFDFLVAYRKQSQAAQNQTLTKRRWHSFVKEMELSLSCNIADLMKHHPDKSDIEDLVEPLEGELDFDALAHLFESVAEARDGEGYAPTVEAQAPEEWHDMDSDLELIDEILERASEETEDEETAQATRRPARRRRRS